MPRSLFKTGAVAVGLTRDETLAPPRPLVVVLADRLSPPNDEPVGLFNAVSDSAGARNSESWSSPKTDLGLGFEMLDAWRTWPRVVVVAFDVLVFVDEAAEEAAEDDVRAGLFGCRSEADRARREVDVLGCTAFVRDGAGPLVDGVGVSTSLLSLFGSCGRCCCCCWCCCGARLWGRRLLRLLSAVLPSKARCFESSLLLLLLGSMMCGVGGQMRSSSPSASLGVMPNLDICHGLLIC